MPTNEPHVLVCIGVIDVEVDELETGVVDPAAPRGVREDAEEVVVVLVRQSRPDEPITKSGWSTRRSPGRPVRSLKLPPDILLIPPDDMWCRHEHFTADLGVSPV
jgi:hypothetical protein